MDGLKKYMQFKKVLRISTTYHNILNTYIYFMHFNKM